MWLQECVVGQDCWQVLLGPKQRPVATQLSEAVSKLSRTCILTNRFHGIQDELQILDERLPTVADKTPRLRSRIEDVLSQCRRLAENLPSGIEQGVHRDFYPDQVVVSGKRLYVLDHDLCCLGDPCLDIANFCAHLIERGIREPSNAKPWGHAADIIVSQFVASTSFSSTSTIETYLTLSLARHIYLSTQFPERRTATDGILELCEQRLEMSQVNEV